MIGNAGELNVQCPKPIDILFFEENNTIYSLFIIRDALLKNNPSSKLFQYSLLKGGSSPYK